MGKSKNRRPQMNAEKREFEPTGVASVPVIPEFTIRADSAFGIHCMMAIAAHVDKLLPEERPAVLRKLREFDLYEEMIRTTPDEEGSEAEETDEAKPAV